MTHESVIHEGLPEGSEPQDEPVTSRRRVLRGLDRLSGSLTLVAAVLVALMIPLGLWDVGSRELGFPDVPGAGQLTALLLASLAVLAWPGVEADDGHVTTTLLVDRLRPRVGLVVRLAGQIVAIAVVGWLALASFGRAQESVRIAETTTGVEALPVWPVRVLLTGALVILLLQMVASIFRLLASRSTAPGGSGPAPKAIVEI